MRETLECKKSLDLIVHFTNLDPGVIKEVFKAFSTMIQYNYKLGVKQFHIPYLGKIDLEKNNFDIINDKILNFSDSNIEEDLLKSLIEKYVQI